MAAAAKNDKWADIERRCVSLGEYRRGADIENNDPMFRLAYLDKYMGDIVSIIDKIDDDDYGDLMFTDIRSDMYVCAGQALIEVVRLANILTNQHLFRSADEVASAISKCNYYDYENSGKVPYFRQLIGAELVMAKGEVAQYILGIKDSPRTLLAALRDIFLIIAELLLEEREKVSTWILQILTSYEYSIKTE